MDARTPNLLERGRGGRPSRWAASAGRRRRCVSQCSSWWVTAWR